MFSWFLRKKNHPNLSSDFSDTFRDSPPLTEFLQQYSVTEDHDWLDFDSEKFDQYCSGLLEIISIGLFDMLRTDRKVICELEGINGDKVFFECALFLSFVIDELGHSGVLDYDRFGHSDFRDFWMDSASFYDKLFYNCPDTCQEAGKDFDDIVDDRRDLYSYTKETDDPIKTMSYKFSQVLHQNRTAYQFDFDSDLLSEAPNMMALHACVEPKASESLKVLIATLTRPLYNYRHQR